MNVIKPFDISKKVYVYRNLNKKCWSIKQHNLVVAYCDWLCLSDCVFKVSVKGRDKVLIEKRKNVHAYVIGYISDVVPCSNELSYNPYTYEWFYDVNTLQPIYNCYNVLFKSDFKAFYR